MNSMSEVLQLAKQAGIPYGIIARKILGVSRAIMHSWATGVETIPQSRVEQLEELKRTIQHYIDSGKLPLPQEDLVWLGLLEVTKK